VSVRTLAITGATGFVGQTLLQHAVAAGWSVRALTRTPKSAVDGVTWIAGSLEKPAALAGLVEGCDVVIHVAGVVNAPNRAAFAAGNITGTQAIIDAAARAHVHRVLHVSSLAAREPALSNYGWSKAEAEAVVEASTLDWTIIRPPAIYGPGDKDMLDLFKMAARGLIMLPPNGRISVIEVSDLARLLIKLIDQPTTHRAIYEVDDGRAGGWSHDEFGRAIGVAVGKRPVTFAMPRFALRIGATLDRMMRSGGARLTPDRVAYLCHPDWVVDRAHNVPPEIWVPEVEMPAGLRVTAAAYRAAGWL
jgi:uncharacterized protein YbjT (DUF2867 family)